MGDENVTTLDSFFENSKIFIDSSVFASDWIPDYFLFREKEVNTIRQDFADMIKGRPGHIWCNGLPSTGKTHIVKKTVKEFNDYCETKGYNARYVYATEREKTLPRFLSDVLLALNPDANVVTWNSGQAKDDIIKEASKYENIAFIFDEIDKIVPSRHSNPINSLIGTFSRLQEGYPNFKAKYMLVVVSNDTALYRHLEASSASSFVASNIHFPGYDAVQIGKIFEERCKKGLHEGVIDDGIIAYLASQIFKGSKDVRTGLKILLEGGKLAEHNGKATITKDHLKQGAEIVEKNKLIETIVKLDDSQIALLLSIARSQKDKPNELVASNINYRNYERVVNQYELDLLKPRYLNESVAIKLDMIGLITTALSGGGYKKGVQRHFQIIGEDLNEIIAICDKELQRRNNG